MRATISLLIFFSPRGSFVIVKIYITLQVRKVDDSRKRGDCRSSAARLANARAPIAYFTHAQRTLFFLTSYEKFVSVRMSIRKVLYNSTRNNFREIVYAARA